MATQIPQKQHNYLLWTKHSPCFPSQHDAFLQVPGAQFLVPLLQECRIIGKCKTLWFWYVYETWNICPGPGKKHKFMWCLNISYFQTELYLYVCRGESASTMHLNMLPVQILETRLSVLNKHGSCT